MLFRQVRPFAYGNPAQSTTCETTQLFLLTRCQIDRELDGNFKKKKSMFGPLTASQSLFNKDITVAHMQPVRLFLV
jgi:hypothetical protein